MKNVILFIVMFLPLLVFGQDEEKKGSTGDTDTLSITPESIKEMMREVLQEDSDAQDLGVCRSSKIGEKIKCQSGAELTLDSISIAIFDGVIQDIVLYVTDTGGNSSTIWNKTIISVPDFETRRGDNIGAGNNSLCTVKLEDVLNIESFIGKRGYVPDDIAFTLTKENPSRILKINTDINSYLDARVYTDAFALFNDNIPNGLVQTEISTRFFVRTQNKANKNKIWFNYLDFQLGFAKYDNDFSTLPLSKQVGNEAFDVDREHLFQQSWAWVGINSNILNRWINKSHHKKFRWDVGVNGYWSRVGEDADSISQNAFNTFLPTYHTSLGFNLKRGENFGVDMGVRGFAQHLTSDDNKIANKGWMYYLNPEVEVYYHPLGKKRSKVFLRYRNYINLTDGDDGPVDFEFQQLQVGYQYKFTDLFSKGR